MRPSCDGLCRSESTWTGSRTRIAWPRWPILRPCQSSLLTLSRRDASLPGAAAARCHYLAGERGLQAIRVFFGVPSVSGWHVMMNYKLSLSECR